MESKIESAFNGLFQNQDQESLDMEVEDWSPETSSICQLQIGKVYSLASKPSSADLHHKEAKVDRNFNKMRIKDVSSLDSGSMLGQVKIAAIQQMDSAPFLDCLPMEDLNIIKEHFLRNVLPSSENPPDLSQPENVLQELFLPVHFTEDALTGQPEQVSSTSEVRTPGPSDPLRDPVPQRISVIMGPRTRFPTVNLQDQVQESAPPVKRGRGRPKGSKNKKKTVSSSKKFCERCVDLRQTCRSD